MYTEVLYKLIVPQQAHNVYTTLVSQNTYATLYMNVYTTLLRRM